jgi:drug/metabolite transporter (DMT)-like permease
MAMCHFLAIEKLTKYKALAVIIRYILVLTVGSCNSFRFDRSLTGISIVSISDSSTGTQLIAKPDARPSLALLGDFLALISSVFYALYVIFMKLKVGSETRMDMQLFFGFVGLYDILLYWILGVALHYFGIEHFALPSGRIVIFNIVLNVSSDLAFLKTNSDLRIHVLERANAGKQLFICPCTPQNDTTGRNSWRHTLCASCCPRRRS